MSTRQFGKEKPRDPDYIAQHGGTITVKELEAYADYMQESADLDIRLYWEVYINRKSLRRVAEEFGISYEQVRTRTKRLIGYVTSMKTTP